ncbi:MAG: class I SAM-dependent methyltransferase [Rhodobacterales bacterium]|nr:class I SAM-dependent methyltransferase [Rhodobacterales bacterium]NCT12798.1 class I SAM-dependent methyltransferase [Rhodobacterales bacterium]
MSTSRLETALTQGLLAIPPGPITLMRPQAGYDLAGLPRDRLAVCHSFRPDCAHWEAMGLPVSQTPRPAVAAVVVVPRSKALARGLIAQACAIAPLVVVDGQRTDGIDSLWREVRAALGDLPGVTKAHGRLFWFAATGAFADWAVPAPVQGPDGYFTQPGVFSEGGQDRGSLLLAQALPPKLPARLADLGAGWGYLSAAALTRTGVQSVDLIEAEALALDCARRNVTDPRAGFVWADATQHAPATPYDGIIMNPPFHAGRAADPALGRAFIAAAARMLAPSGQLWMVANRHLPYEATLRETFRNVADAGGDGAFKVFHATRPLR